MIINKEFNDITENINSYVESVKNKKVKLTEILDIKNAAPYTLVDDESNYEIYEFKLADYRYDAGFGKFPINNLNNFYQIIQHNCQLSPSEFYDNIKLIYDKVKDYDYISSFGFQSTDPSGNPSITLTGDCPDVPKLFSTLLAIIEEYVTKTNKAPLIFGSKGLKSDEPSKYKAYTALLRLLSKRYKFQYYLLNSETQPNAGYIVVF